MHSPSINRLAHRLVKTVALFQLLLALGILVLDVKLPGDNSWSIASMITAGSLVMIFWAQETINDERVEQLKLKAIRVGLLLGTLGAMFATLFVTMSGMSMPFSAFDVLTLIMLIALGCFYSWRWQDSRPPS